MTIVIEITWQRQKMFLSHHTFILRMMKSNFNKGYSHDLLLLHRYLQRCRVNL